MTEKEINNIYNAIDAIDDMLWEFKQIVKKGNKDEIMSLFNLDDIYKIETRKTNINILIGDRILKYKNRIKFLNNILYKNVKA